MEDYGPPELQMQGSYPMGTFQGDVQPSYTQKQPGRDVFGAVLDDTYKEFYDEFDEDEKEVLETKPVMIPRYSGPVRTRCDHYTPSNGVYQIRGITNHRQHSNVYLSKTITFKLGEDYLFNDTSSSVLSSLDFAPFSIQQNWSNVRWRCPQTSNEYQYDVPAMVKLAPYLCSADSLKKQCRTKVSYCYGEDGGHIPQAPITFPGWLAHNFNGRRKDVSVTFYEPLLGFQSGWERLKAIRPFDQQNAKYPLAIQDYNLQVTEKPNTVELYEMLRDYRTSATDDIKGDTKSVGFYPMKYSAPAEYDMRRPGMSKSVSPYRLIDSIQDTGPAELISFASHDSKQENKTVSTVMLHAPQMLVQRKKFTLTNTQDNVTYRQQNFKKTQKVTLGSAMATSLGFPRVMEFEFSSRRGLPSFFMFYLEETGNKRLEQDDAWEPLLRDFYFPNANISTYPQFNICKRQCPKIANMILSSFEQEYPITKQLQLEDLEYLTCKNSHPQCEFHKLASRDSIVFLKMEDIGTGADSKGYPEDRRVSFKIKVNEILVPETMRHYLDINSPAPEYVLTAALIYENQVLEGTNDRTEFRFKA